MSAMGSRRPDQGGMARLTFFHKNFHVGEIKEVGAGGGTRTLTGLAPNGFSYRLRLSPPLPLTGFAVWTIPSPCPAPRARCRCCPSSLYTFPVLSWTGLGSGLPFEGFPEFGQFYTAGFPAGTQSLKSVASTSSATPARRGKLIRVAVSGKAPIAQGTF